MSSNSLFQRRKSFAFSTGDAHEIAFGNINKAMQYRVETAHSLERRVLEFSGKGLIPA